MASAWDYGYDGRSRLTSAVRTQGGTAVSATYAYTYDDADNMLTKTEPWGDDFADGGFETWNPRSGTWSAAAGYVTNTNGTTAELAHAQPADDFER